MVSRADIVASRESAKVWIDDIDVSYLLSAVLTVQAGDVLTTYVAIYGLGLAEVNPFMVAVLNRLGILGLIATKFWWYGIAITGAFLVDDSRGMLRYCFLVYLLVGGPALLINVATIAVLLF